MRVAFLLHELGRAGGMDVIAGHARRLNACDGLEAEIVLTAGDGSLDGVEVRSLAAARERDYDVVLATWWETAAALWELRAGARAVFLQSLEERFYGDDELWQRFGAASVLGLPLHFVTIGGWLRDVARELRPDALCAVVRNGIDKSVFRPPKAPGGDANGPLRVLVEGQPDLWFKGVPEAIAAARAVDAPVTVTLVAPEPERAGELGADRVVGGLDAAGMAALYGEHDVLLKLSRVEGVALAPIEAMHCGVPCVVTPHTGHDEYVRHGQNGLVVGFDDPHAATAAVAGLARDRELLARLSDGALATAAEWPDPDASTAALTRALGELAAAPSLDPAPAMRLLHARRRLAIELGRAQLGRLEWNERAVEDLRAIAEGLRTDIVRADVRTNAVYRQLDAVKDERAYRAAVRARRVVHRITGRNPS